MDPLSRKGVIKSKPRTLRHRYEKLALAFAAGTLALTGTYRSPGSRRSAALGPAHGKRAKDRAIYDSRGRYYSRAGSRARPHSAATTRYYCKRDNGTTGSYGAGVGALAGREIAGSGDRTLGAILGGAVGALAGREIDRGMQCR